MRFKKEYLLLYAVTDRAPSAGADLYDQVEKALQGGVTCVQLREKCMDEGNLINEAVKLRKLCHRYGVPLIINDNLNVALESGADGVHVGQEDMDAGRIRELTGEKFIIGVTAKTVAQAEKAQSDGADYIGTGAVFPSPTKKNAVRITREQLKKICRSVDIPAVAIGGINLSNMGEMKGCGMSGFAVASAVFAAEDIVEEARRLKAQALCTVTGNGG